MSSHEAAKDALARGAQKGAGLNQPLGKGGSVEDLGGDKSRGRGNLALLEELWIGQQLVFF